MTKIETNSVRELFNAQEENQWKVRQTTAKERIAQLNALKDALIARTPEIIEAAQKDFARPEAEENSQIQAVVEVIQYTTAHLEEWMKPEVVPSGEDAEVRIVYEPKGVICIMGTWNSPLSTCIHPLVEALASGNCVVLKPSELSPHYADIIRVIIEDVFKANHVAVVTGDATVANELLQIPFNHFFFTGSPRVGKLVMEGAAKHLASVTLELGGKSPVILDRGYDMQQAAQQLVFGKILMGGQLCISPDYIFVHEDDVTNFVVNYEGVTKYMLYDESGKIRYDERTTIVNEAHYERLKSLFTDAIEKGATILAGGDFNDEKRLIEPTVLGNVTEDMRISEEEVFGPITFIKPYKTVDEVIHYIQKRPKPLAMYPFSKNRDFQEALLQGTSSGGVTINGIIMHNVHPGLPFGGVNNSGIGSFHGIHGFKGLSHARAVYHIL